MSALEIILVSVLGLLVVIAVIYIFIVNANKRNHLETFEVINEDALKNSIVFCGDSLTDFFPVQDFFLGKIIYNRGIAADTTKDLLNRLDNIIEIEPCKVFVQIGTNDLGKLKSPAYVVKNIEQIYQRLLAGVPNVEIIAISLYPVTHRKMWLSPLIVGFRSNKKIRQTNELLKQLTDKYEIPYLDLYRDLSNEKGSLDKRYTLEGLHISGQGYGVIAQKLKDYFTTNC